MQNRLFSAYSFFHLGLIIFFIAGMSLRMGRVTGYSIGVAILLGVSLYTIIRYRESIDFKADKSIAGIFALYAAIGAMAHIVGHHGMNDFESVIRFILAIPIIYTAIYLGINRLVLMLSIVLGTIVMTYQGYYEVLQLGYTRAGLYPIRFGDIGIMMGFFSFISLFYVPVEYQYRRVLQILLLIGGVCGVATSVFSGSRGGWLFPPVAIIILAAAIAYQVPKARKVVLTCLLLGLAGVASIYFTPSTGVQARLTQAVHEAIDYQPNTATANTSIGGRLEMWRLASGLIMEKPLTGWGITGYRNRMEEFYHDGEGAAQISGHRHPHNEILNDAVKRGIPSTIVMVLGLYLFPFIQFFRRLRHPVSGVRYYATMGMAFITGWVVFGWSDVFLEWNQVILYYLIYMAVCWGGMRHEEKHFH